ncbi:Mitochondrial zinc maintenance protein [Paramyrothecium foliicola]|nr:Mitochondrial zinc maintenance protein [Paramyrothecium foliicola]
MTMALAAYRNLMRAARIAFQGDAPVLAAAHGQIRNEFRQRAALDPTDSSVTESIKHAQDVAKFLRENVVQGIRGDEAGTYKLRIHKDTERGDNESIKTAGKGLSSGGGCCGGSK